MPTESDPSLAWSDGGQLQLTGGLRVSGPLSVKGPASLVGELRVAGAIDAKTNMHVAGQLSVGSSTASGRLATVNGKNAAYAWETNSTSGYVTTVKMDDKGLSIGHNSSSRSLKLYTNGRKDRGLSIDGSGNTTLNGNLMVNGTSSFRLPNGGGQLRILSNPRDQSVYIEAFSNDGKAHANSPLKNADCCWS